MSAPAQAPSQPPRVKRSQFIEKLHDLLEHPYDPDSLRWTPDGEGFEITTNEPKARNALSPKWDFRSLSSFIRQLSYYNFKRLSDRRRSTERRGSSANYIVFSHPTGFFLKGDNSKLDGIVRKTRTRPTDKPRRDSLASTASADDTAAPSPFSLYDGGDLQYGAHAGPSYSNGPVPSFGFAPPGQAPRPYQPPSLPPDTLANWRNYQAGFQNVPPVAPPDIPRFGFAAPPMGPPAPHMQYDYSQGPPPPPQGYRRGSLSEFKVGVSPRSKPADLPGTAAYQSTMRTHSPLGLHDPATANGAPFHSPYPAPSFPPHPHHPSGVSHEYLYPGHAPPPPHGPSVPSGLPALSYDPQGHRSSYPPSSTSGYAPMPPVLQPPTIPSLLPNHLQTQPHLAAGGSGGPGGAGDVLPSPTYSSEEDGHPPPGAPSNRAFFPPTYPSNPPPPHGQNPFPHLTHFHPPGPDAPASQGLAPLQIPPFGPGPASAGAPPLASPQSASAAPSGRATPVHPQAPQQHGHPQQHAQQQYPPQQQPPQPHPHALMAQKLGWAPPPPGGAAGPPGAAVAGVFSNWQGFAARDGAGAGYGPRGGEERGAGS
ncbi:hypothetical protein JCM10450v2_004486 [Rhodotorula kratochvilovae]